MDDREKMSGHVPVRRDMSQRFCAGGFTYPFGSYPEEEFRQAEGYDSRYLKDDGCFYYEIILSHEKTLDAFLSLCALLPEKVYLVVKINSGDFYRDHDTYISEEMISRADLASWVDDWKDVVLDDGFIGFGMFAEGGGAEVFLDDHKTIHVYHKDPDVMEPALEEMGLPFIMDVKFFWDGPHYHEPLPLDEDYGDDYLTAFEDLADLYELYLDEDEDEDTAPDGDPIGITCWKVEIRGYIPASASRPVAQGFYSTVYINAESRKDVSELVDEYLSAREEQVDLYLQMARVPFELLTSEMRVKNPGPNEPCVWHESERIVFDWDMALD
jgi:hypothetical protein